MVSDLRPLRPTNQPSRVFIGRNFMTPNIIGYFRLRVGFAELSTGTGMANQPIWGVTIRKSNGSRLSPDPSDCFQSKQDALDLIRSLS